MSFPFLWTLSYLTIKKQVVSAAKVCSEESGSTRYSRTVAKVASLYGRSRAGQNTARAGSGHGQHQVQYTSNRTSGAAVPPPVQPGPRPAGSEGGYVGYDAATAPSRPALVLGSGSCTNNCGNFRIKTFNELICDILLCRTGTLAPIPDLGRPGSEGGDAGYGAATVPSRPALVLGSGSCTNNCKILELKH